MRTVGFCSKRHWSVLVAAAASRLTISFGPLLGRWNSPAPNVLGQILHVGVGDVGALLLPRVHLRRGTTTAAPRGRLRPQMMSAPQTRRRVHQEQVLGRERLALAPEILQQAVGRAQRPIVVLLLLLVLFSSSLPN